MIPVNPTSGIPNYTALAENYPSVNFARQETYYKIDLLKYLPMLLGIAFLYFMI